MNGCSWTALGALDAMLGRQRARPDGWMTPAQFTRWADAVGPPHTRGDPIGEAIGFSKPMVRDRRRGNVAVSKCEALACAHFSLGLALPDALEVEAFGPWFAERFGTAAQITAWLELRAGHINIRLRGFEVREGERIARPLDLCLLRALDWVHRVGPIVPWPLG